MSKEIHFKRDVRVVVEVHNQSAPPKLLFSFPGLEDPVEIWDDLRQLGWEIPDRPPHPPPEIDWDAPEGSRYHVLPYRVEEFGITASRWPSFEVAERGLETINALRRFGVDLEVPGLVPRLSPPDTARTSARSRPVTGSPTPGQSSAGVAPQQATVLGVGRRRCNRRVRNRHRTESTQLVLGRVKTELGQTR